jgi:predicted HicB family RNase H-like nuclease
MSTVLEMQHDTTEAPKRGRKPTREKTSDARLVARVLPEHKADWEAKAKAAGKTLSTWLVDTLNAAKK